MKKKRVTSLALKRARGRNFAKRRISAIRGAAASLSKSPYLTMYEREKMSEVEEIAETVLTGWGSR